MSPANTPKPTRDQAAPQDLAIELLTVGFTGTPTDALVSRALAAQDPTLGALLANLVKDSKTTPNHSANRAAIAGGILEHAMAKELQGDTAAAIYWAKLACKALETKWMFGRRMIGVKLRRATKDIFHVATPPKAPLEPVNRDTLNYELATYTALATAWRPRKRGEEITPLEVAVLSRGYFVYGMLSQRYGYAARKINKINKTSNAKSSDPKAYIAILRANTNRKAASRQLSEVTTENLSPGTAIALADAKLFCIGHKSSNNQQNALDSALGAIASAKPFRLTGGHFIDLATSKLIVGILTEHAWQDARRHVKAVWGQVITLWPRRSSMPTCLARFGDYVRLYDHERDTLEREEATDPIFEYLRAEAMLILAANNFHRDEEFEEFSGAHDCNHRLSNNIFPAIRAAIKSVPANRRGSFVCINALQLAIATRILIGADGLALLFWQDKIDELSHLAAMSKNQKIQEDLKGLKSLLSNNQTLSIDDLFAEAEDARNNNHPITLAAAMHYLYHRASGDDKYKIQQTIGLVSIVGISTPVDAIYAISVMRIKVIE